MEEELLRKKITEAKEKAAKALSSEDVPSQIAAVKDLLSVIDVMAIACLEEEEESKKSRNTASSFIKKNKKK